MQKRRNAESSVIINTLPANLAWPNCRQEEIHCWRNLSWYWVLNRLFPSTSYVSVC